MSQSHTEIYIHRLLNTERRKAGLRELDYDAQLALIARDHSIDMAGRNYFSHQNPEGKDSTGRARSAGYSCRKQVDRVTYTGMAENIFMSDLYKSRGLEWEVVKMPDGREIRRNERLVANPYTNVEIAQLAVSNWMASPGHRRNILTPHFNLEGIGVATTSRMVYITQNLF